MARDHDALDLGGSLTDLADLCVAHEPLDRIILRVAVAAVDLHRLDRGSHGELRAEQLCHRRLFAEWPAVLGPPSGVKHQVPARLDLVSHVRNFELNSLKTDGRLAE